MGGYLSIFIIKYIFEFVLQLAKNRSEGAQLILDTMYIENNMISEHIFA